VLVLAGLTQYEADRPGLPGTTTTYVLSVEFRGAVGDPLGVTETLTTSCRALVDEDTEIEIVEGPGAIMMRLSPSPGDNDERPFLGCLNDALARPGPGRSRARGAGTARGEGRRKPFEDTRVMTITSGE
jgi:hypothetical protein